VGSAYAAFAVYMVERDNVPGIVEASGFVFLLTGMWCMLSANILGSTSPAAQRYLMFLSEARAITISKVITMAIIISFWLLVQILIAVSLDSHLDFNAWIRLFFFGETVMCFMVAAGAVASLWFPKQPDLSHYSDLFSSRWALAMTIGGAIAGLMVWLIVTLVFPGFVGVVLALALGGGVLYVTPRFIARPRLWRKALLDV
jgi:hypothetical protein